MMKEHKAMDNERIYLVLSLSFLFFFKTEDPGNWFANIYFFFQKVDLALFLCDL